MHQVVTIRLEKHDRALREVAARTTGIGIDGHLLPIARSEPRRLQREGIRADGDRLVAYREARPDARAEFEMLGTPISELP